jgi:anti-sigma factor RsiW
VSALCETVRAELPRYLKDTLAAGDRREIRKHLASCESCAIEIARIEPSLLFARIPADDVSSEDVERVLAGVRAGIALVQTERKVGQSRRRSRRRLAAMASAAALASMTLLLPGSGRRPVDAVTTVPPPAVSAPAPGFAPATQAAPSGTFPADATIYDWNPGATSPEPRVVWIVDRSLDI